MCNKNKLEGKSLVYAPFESHLVLYLLTLGGLTSGHPYIPTYYMDSKKEEGQDRKRLTLSNGERIKV